MSQLQAQVVINFGDQNYVFALRSREIENLEKATGATVADIAYRVIGMRPSFSDIKNIILLGLEGGGMPPEQAQAMFDRYVDGKPLYQKDNPSSPAMVAAQVMEAAWFGVAEVLEQPSGKDEAGDPQPADPTEQ